MQISIERDYYLHYPKDAIHNQYLDVGEESESHKRHQGFNSTEL